MLHHRPHTVEEADTLLDTLTEVRAEARANNNRALVVSCDDLILECLALRLAMIPEPREP